MKLINVECKVENSWWWA